MQNLNLPGQKNDRLASVSQALVEGKLIVIVSQPGVIPPTSAGSAVTASAVTSKPVSLGPHEEGIFSNNVANSPHSQNYKTTPLDKAYEGEDDENNPQRWNEPFVCEYIKEEDIRKEYEIGVKDGKLIHLGGKDAGKVFDSSDAATHWGGGGAAIFVMSGNGNIYASKKHEPMFFHHSSFLAGEPVASAGELVVHNGKLIEVSNKSGHYKPKQETNDQLMTVLGNKGLSKSDLNEVIRTGV